MPKAKIRNNKMIQDCSCIEKQTNVTEIAAVAAAAVVVSQNALPPDAML